MSLNDSDFLDWLIGVRRDFHMYPELSHQETCATRRIVAIMKELGIDTRRFDDMTGAVGLIAGSTRGKTIALQADIDALPLTD